MTTSSEPSAAIGSDMDLRERYEHIMQRVAAAAESVGRRPEEIHVILVSKYGTMEQIRELIDLGHRDFGESRVQQLEERAGLVSEWIERRQKAGVAGDQSLTPDSIRWHMVGHLQRNKAKKAIQFARLIHGVDSLRLAEEIQTIADKRDHPVQLLLQVNTSGERQKHGISPPAVRHLVDQIDTMLNVSVRGMMCMAENTADESRVRLAFERCEELFSEIRTVGSGGEDFNILSMGMSGDFETAIRCGSNCVRIGSAVFANEGRAAEPDADAS